MSAKYMGQILLLLPRRAGEGGKSGMLVEALRTLLGLSSHCPLQKIGRGSKSPTAEGERGCSHPTGPTWALLSTALLHP